MEAATSSGWATETVEFPSDGFTIRAFLAKPLQGSAPVPTVLILHEWWGLNDHIKDIARRFAAAGYAALAVDLYSRQGYKVTADPAEAGALMDALSSQAALRDLNAATKYLKAQPFIDAWRLGVLGFCMGGTLALTQAAHNSDLKAAVVFYGKVPPIETFRYLLCPVLYHHGAKDGWVTRQEVERLQNGLKAHGKPGQVYTYPEADHAFFNDTRPEVYRAQDAALAWDRTLQFLSRHLS
jgi:carboxymethylenebutenolidase